MDDTNISCDPSRFISSIFYCNCKKQNHIFFFLICSLVWLSSELWRDLFRGAIYPSIGNKGNRFLSFATFNVFPRGKPSHLDTSTMASVALKSRPTGREGCWSQRRHRNSLETLLLVQSLCRLKTSAHKKERVPAPHIMVGLD